MTKPTPIDVKVRMPRDMHRRIQREADRHGQTADAEILGRLVFSFDSQKTFATLEDQLVALNKSLARVNEAIKTPDLPAKDYVDFLARSFNVPADEIVRTLGKFGEYREQQNAELKRDKADD
jgi:uncharacterized membrane protein